MAATVHFVSPEDAEVLRKYMTPGDSNQGIALIFSKEAQTALEDARAGTSQVQVMQAAQALIDAKRQGQSKP